jgi:hypothetical protein
MTVQNKRAEQSEDASDFCDFGYVLVSEPRPSAITRSACIPCPICNTGSPPFPANRRRHISGEYIDE